MHIYTHSFPRYFMHSGVTKGVAAAVFFLRGNESSRRVLSDFGVSAGAGQNRRSLLCRHSRAPKGTWH
jgi:hypothetical protein